MAESGKVEFSYLQRVKVYRLNDDGKWDDKGTGHVSVEYLERSDAVGLIVIDEQDSATLLVHRISADDIYQRQEDTIISWTDPEVATDLALSFQESMGCAYIWDHICSVQRQLQFPGADGGLSDASIRLKKEDDGMAPAADDRGTGPTASDGPEIPAPSLANLSQLAKVFSEIPHFHRDRMASFILRENYVAKTVDVFRICEDVDNVEGLHSLYRIIKGIFTLNDGNVFEQMFSNALIMDVIGMLEYDPDLPERQSHRQFLRDQVKYREAIPIGDAGIMSKIHQTYRIAYIKDVILARALDDQTFGTLSSMLLFNNVEILTSLQKKKEFLSDLFSRLKSKDCSAAQWLDLVLFLQEYCSLHRHLQQTQRNQSYQALIAKGLFEVVTSILQHHDPKARAAGMDILMSSLLPDPGPLRSFLVEQPGNALFSCLMDLMTRPADSGLQVQTLEMLRLLLDSDTMETMEKSTFLDLFYEKFIERLMAAVVAGSSSAASSVRKRGQSAAAKVAAAESSEQRAKGEEAASTSEATAATAAVEEGGADSELVAAIPADVLVNICELFCFCVLHHSFRIKYFILRNNLVEKVLRLLKRREKYLAVATIRFLRTCIGIKDDFYSRYLVKNNLFQPLFNAFFANGVRYNLLNSAVLELVDFVRKESLVNLIDHLVESFGPQLKEVDYVETFKQLQLKYDQLHDSSSQKEAAAAGGEERGAAAAAAARGGAGGARAGEGAVEKLTIAAAVGAVRRRRDERELDDDEEKYFEVGSDDEEDTASAPPLSVVVPPSSSSSPSIHSPRPSAGFTPRATSPSHGPQLPSDTSSKKQPPSSSQPGQSHARLHVVSMRQSSAAPLVVNGSNSPQRLGSGLGLVDYDDEDDDGVPFPTLLERDSKDSRDSKEFAGQRSPRPSAAAKGMRKQEGGEGGKVTMVVGAKKRKSVESSRDHSVRDAFSSRNGVDGSERGSLDGKRSPKKIVIGEIHRRLDGGKESEDRDVSLVQTRSSLHEENNASRVNYAEWVEVNTLRLEESAGAQRSTQDSDFSKNRSASHDGAKDFHVASSSTFVENEVVVGKCTEDFGGNDDRIEMLEKDGAGHNLSSSVVLPESSPETFPVR